MNKKYLNYLPIRDRSRRGNILATPVLRSYAACTFPHIAHTTGRDIGTQAGVGMDAYLVYIRSSDDSKYSLLQPLTFPTMRLIITNARIRVLNRSSDEETIQWLFSVSRFRLRLQTIPSGYGASTVCKKPRENTCGGPYLCFMGQKSKYRIVLMRFTVRNKHCGCIEITFDIIGNAE